MQLTTTLRRTKARPLTIGPASITIRPAYADDESTIARLAALDSAEIPSAPILLAEVDGQLRAALSVNDGAVIADPFFPSVHLVELLSSHAAATAPAPATRRSYRLRYA
jgi:hypothetical protein